jgi:ribonuclease BN (tRNA processing enzyme)
MEENEKILKFYSEADILVHDTQYKAVEFEKHLGWGHSSYEYAIEAACQTNVRKLVFFHYDPNNSDEELESLDKHYKNEAGKKSQMEIIMAREGLTIEA